MIDHVTQRENFYERLKRRWQVTGWGLIVICCAFALTGISVLKIGRPIVNSIVPPDAPRWIWWTVKIVIILPLYEVILVVIGMLLGQGRFFRDKARRQLRFLARPFRGRRA